MSEKMLTLYDLCLERTAELLKSCYWDTHFPFGCNPFRLMPSAIVDALIVHLARLSVLTPLQSSDLRLLLTSGQVREFVLEDINVSAEHLQEILMDLASACEKVTKIKIRNVTCDIVDRTNFHMKKHTLNSLLSEAHNVRYVESCLEFDLDVICHAHHLEKLVLNFPVKNHLFDFLEVNGQLTPNFSLKCLEVFEDPRHPISYLDIAVVMKYCLELREINCDISKSLEYLHGEELFNGTLSCEYKIEKCHLGSVYVSAKEAVVSRDGVYIASLTCPQLRDVSMLVSDDQAIYALSDFKNIKNLLIQWEKMEFGDYSIGVQLLLEKPEVGQSLISLDILNFTNVDFASIGACCPNLEALRVEYELENNQRGFSSGSFKKLKLLQLENLDDRDVNMNTLIGLLSNATDLKSLAIVYGGQLTDGVLQDILKKNSLVKLKDIRISRCVLSVNGIRTLVSSCKALEYFEIGETDINFDEVVSVIHQINPLVILSNTLID